MRSQRRSRDRSAPGLPHFLRCSTVLVNCVLSDRLLSLPFPQRRLPILAISDQDLEPAGLYSQRFPRHPCQRSAFFCCFSFFSPSFFFFLSSFLSILLSAGSSIRFSFQPASAFLLPWAPLAGPSQIVKVLRALCILLL